MNLNNKNFRINYNNGFTIIEALIAIFILSISVVSMLGVTASSASYARYSNNEITVNYLLQEAIDSVRNSRDTIAFQMKDSADGGWNKFLQKYGYLGDKCFSTNGCYIDMENFDSTGKNNNEIKNCDSSGCPLLKIKSSSSSNKLFYNYESGNEDSIFSRKVNMVINPSNIDEVKVTATVIWNNGNGSNQRSSKLEVSLLNWMN